MGYPLPGKESAEERVDRKATLLALLSFAVLGCGLWIWLYPSHQRTKEERAFLWSVAFSDERIQSLVGRVKDAQIERESAPSGRRSREAHYRRTEGDLVTGEIRFLIFGDEGAVKATIAYKWNHVSSEHSITGVNIAVIWSAKGPNNQAQSR